MGNICCKIEQLSKNLKQPKEQLVEAIDHEISTASRFFDTFKLSDIDDTFKEVHGEVDESRAKKTGQLLVDVEYEHHDIKVKVWGQLVPQLSSSNKLHQYFTEKDMPFTPDAFFLFLINRTPEIIMKIDTDLNKYEIIKHETSKDMIMTISYFTTKKILLVSSKEFFVVRVVKRVSDDEFMELTRSIHLTDLRNVDCVDQVLSDMKNQASIHLSGMHFKRNGNRTYYKGFTYIDVSSSVGMIILKPILKKKIATCHSNMMDEFVRFIEFRDKNEDYVWFDGLKDDINRTFSVNKGILRSLRGEDNLVDTENRKPDSFHTRTDTQPQTHISDIEQVAYSGSDKLQEAMRQALADFEEYATLELEKFKLTDSYKKFSALNTTSDISVESLNATVSSKRDQIRKEIEGNVAFNPKTPLTRSSNPDIDITAIDKSLKKTKNEFLSFLDTLNNKIETELLLSEKLKYSLHDMIDSPIEKKIRKRPLKKLNCVTGAISRFQYNKANSEQLNVAVDSPFRKKRVKSDNIILDIPSDQNLQIKPVTNPSNHFFNCINDQTDVNGHHIDNNLVNYGKDKGEGFIPRNSNGKNFDDVTANDQVSYNPIQDENKCNNSGFEQSLP